jgi:hypothetical protein
MMLAVRFEYFIPRGCFSDAKEEVLMGNFSFFRVGRQVKSRFENTEKSDFTRRQRKKIISSISQWKNTPKKFLEI